MRHDEREEALREALVELVNAQIHASGITLEEAALVFAEEAKSALDCLAWQPHAQRAAAEHLVAAVACL
jgi:hypothetical protein